MPFLAALAVKKQRRGMTTFADVFTPEIIKQQRCERIMKFKYPGGHTAFCSILWVFLSCMLIYSDFALGKLSGYGIIAGIAIISVMGKWFQSRFAGYVFLILNATVFMVQILDFCCLLDQVRGFENWPKTDWPFNRLLATAYGTGVAFLFVHKAPTDEQTDVPRHPKNVALCDPHGE